MANEIRIHTSCEIVQDNDVTVDGIAYTHRALDGNADSRSWGGSYTLNAAYNDADVAYWKNAVIDVTSADGLNDGTAFEGNASVTDGTLPATVYCLAVEFVSMLGTATTVSVSVSGVKTNAGQSAFTRIPLFPKELAMSLVSPITPAFPAGYGSSPVP